MNRICFYLGLLITIVPLTTLGQSAVPKQVVPSSVGSNSKMETTEDWNRRLQDLVHSAVSNAKNRPSSGDYRIGPNDELAINVLDAPDLSSAYRVAADGDISIPLLGTIRAAGLTPRELELVLQALLRRTYMKNPQVGITVTEMQSHSVSVLGAVKNPGVFQIRGSRTLLEMLSMAGGLAPEAGNAVLVMRGASAQFIQDKSPQVQGVKAVSATDTTNRDNSVVINLKRLLDTGDPKYNIPVYPGDIVKVKAAGIVYVVGNVNRPGGFPVQDNEHITVLQAIALGQGMAPDSAKNRAAIIRVAQNGKQIEVPVHLDKILSGKAPDLPLRPKDILFVPKNGARSTGRAALRVFTQWAIWRSIY